MTTSIREHYGILLFNSFMCCIYSMILLIACGESTVEALDSFKYLSCLAPIYIPFMTVGLFFLTLTVVILSYYHLKLVVNDARSSEEVPNRCPHPKDPY